MILILIMLLVSINTYTTEATVYEVNGNVVCFETTDGNLWVCEADVEEGKTYNLRFTTNGTDTIYDDEIISIKEAK